MQRVVARGGNRFVTGAVWGVLAVLLVAGLARVPTIPTGEVLDRPGGPTTGDDGGGPVTDERDPGIHGPRFPREDDPRLGGPGFGPAERTGQQRMQEEAPCGLPSYFANESQLESHLGPPDSYGHGSWFSSSVLASSSSSSGMAGYSGTNNQVEGVDEADIVKTDGTYLYIASTSDVRIYRAYPPDRAGLVSILPFPGSVRGLFVNDGRLVVLWQSFTNLDNRAWAYTTHAHVLDVSRPDSPVLERNVTVVARYIAARMIWDQVYLVAGSYVYGPDGDLLLPGISDDGTRLDVQATDVAYFPDSDESRQFAIVLGFDLGGIGRPRYAVFLAADSTLVYVSGTNAYLTGYWGWYGTATTWIHKVAISASSVCYVASGEVPGGILNQFSLDEYRSHLRVTTTTGRVWEGTSSNHLYVLNRTMVRVGALENLAAGERIYSTRFLGERAYLVTFKKVDPLFVIDLADPAAPRVLGYLKIPGYSDYLHPYDRDHVIGLGKDTYDMGNFAWYQGVKVSLFDVSDVEHPTEESKLVIGDRGTYSTALYEHKAFLFVPARGLLVLPIDLYLVNRTRNPNPPPEQSGELVWQGAYAVSVSLGADMAVIGRVAHNPGPGCPSSGPYDGWYGCQSYRVQRSLYIGDVLYTISQKWIILSALDTFAEIRRIAV